MAVLERETASIVLLGSFNPAIFQPSWFERKTLVSPAEAEAAEIEVIHRGVTSLKLANLRLQVIPERFFVEAREPQEQVVLRDMMLSLLRLLRETPISRMGMNWQFHYRLESEENWNHFGHVLAPKAPWEGLIGDTPGLLELKMHGPRIDPPGSMNVVIRPSELYPRRGIFFEINSDYLLPTSSTAAPSVETAAYFENLIKTLWDVGRPQALQIADSLIERGTK